MAVSGVRIVLSGFAFGISTVPYSLAGGLLSLLVMMWLKKGNRFGMTGVSVAGSVCHNIGQTLVAVILLGSKTAFYFPLLLLSGIISGVLIGLTSGIVLEKLRKHIK